MADSETVRGTIALLVRREGQQPIVYEFELRRAAGGNRFARVADEIGRDLREGQEVEVTGRIDANQVLVADTIRPVTPVPTPPPAPGGPWLLLASPAIVGATMWVVVRSIQEGALPRTLWLLAGVAAIAVAQLKAVGRRGKILLRTVGGAALGSALLYKGEEDGLLILLLFVVMILLSVVAAIVAVVLLVRSSMRRVSAPPPAPRA